MPLALGGSSSFATRDASRKYNNDFGSCIDAPFANLWPLAMKRHELLIVGNSGEIPPIVLNGVSLDTGRPLKAEISSSGE